MPWPTKVIFKQQRHNVAKSEGKEKRGREEGRMVHRSSFPSALTWNKKDGRIISRGRRKKMTQGWKKKKTIMRACREESGSSRIHLRPYIEGSGRAGPQTSEGWEAAWKGNRKPTLLSGDPRRSTSPSTILMIPSLGDGWRVLSDTWVICNELPRRSN